MISKSLKILHCLLIAVTLVCCFLIFVVSKSDYSTVLPIVKNLEQKIPLLEQRIMGPIFQDDPELVRYLVQHVLISPSSQPSNLSTDPLYKNIKRQYNWGYIHSYLKSLFSETQNGFFVEAGALDGEFLSNTLWLETNLNWTGLLVEPENSNYRDMVWKRRKAWLSHSCLSNEKYPKMVVMVSSRRLKNSLIPSLVVRGSSFQPGYINFSGNEPYKNFYKQTDFTYYNSQCYPLYAMLLALNVTTIDFLSLDLQGAEIDVFNTIPLEKIFIRSFVIEDSHFKTNLNLIKYFNKLGFDLFAANSAGPDYFFVNKYDFDLIKKAEKIGMAQKLIDKAIYFEKPDIPFGNLVQ